MKFKHLGIEDEPKKDKTMTKNEALERAWRVIRERILTGRTIINLHVTDTHVEYKVTFGPVRADAHEVVSIPYGPPHQPCPVCGKKKLGEGKLYRDVEWRIVCGGCGYRSPKGAKTFAEAWAIHNATAPAIRDALKEVE